MRKHSVTLVKKLLYFVIFMAAVFTVTINVHSLCLDVRTGQGYSSCKLHSDLSANTKQLVLITAGRTGSTFTSAIINRHPGVFYTNEPLHGMPKDIYSRVVSNSTSQKALDTVSGFLNCNFTNLDPHILRSELFEGSKSTEELYNCLRQKKSGYDYLQCFLTMWTSCLKHNTTYVKTIRFRGNWIKPLLERTSNLKILFLVRDFRAVLHSHARVFHNITLTPSIASEKAKAMCSDTREQLQELRKLTSLYPHRIKGVRYEDGSINPIGFAKTIYQFLNFPFDDSIQQYVHEITSANEVSEKNDEFGMRRRDPVATMNKWRKTLDFSVAQVIDKVCGDMYTELGYVPVRSEKELMSDSHFLMTDPKPGGIF